MPDMKVRILSSHPTKERNKMKNKTIYDILEVGDLFVNTFQSTDLALPDRGVAIVLSEGRIKDDSPKEAYILERPYAAYKVYWTKSDEDLYCVTRNSLKHTKILSRRKEKDDNIKI